MKFLADENIEWPLVIQMRHWGYDVATIREIAPRAGDDKVLQLATGERRILLTNDNDFGSMVFHQKMTAYGVVLLRFSEETLDRKIAILEYLLQHHKTKLQGHFTVVSESQIKIRPLEK